MIVSSFTANFLPSSRLHARQLCASRDDWAVYRTGPCVSLKTTPRSRSRSCTVRAVNPRRSPTRASDKPDSYSRWASSICSSLMVRGRRSTSAWLSWAATVVFRFDELSILDCSGSAGAPPKLLMNDKFSGVLFVQ